MTITSFPVERFAAIGGKPCQEGGEFVRLDQFEKAVVAWIVLATVGSVAVVACGIWAVIRIVQVLTA